MSQVLGIEEECLLELRRLLGRGEPEEAVDLGWRARSVVVMAGLEEKSELEEIAGCRCLRNQ